MLTEDAFEGEQGLLWSLLDDCDLENDTALDDVNIKWVSLFTKYNQGDLMVVVS